MSTVPTPTPINTFHQDQWQVSFSNMPALRTIKDMRIYDNFVKGITFPDYNVQEIISYTFPGFIIRHPMGPKPNVDLSQIQIEFKVSEDMLNYIYLFEFMRALKYGDTSQFEDADETFRKNTIKSINIFILDNQKRTRSIWRFTDAFLLNLSALPLQQGVSEELIFSCNFSYSEVVYELKDVMTGG
jgi:hypothetical protein